MATQVVCDICGQGIVEADTEPVEFRKARLSLRAKIFRANDWPEADICAACLHGAAKAHDKSPQAEPGPYMGNLRWLVTLNGIRCPGPHAAFHCEADAKKYVAAWAQGGEVSQA